MKTRSTLLILLGVALVGSLAYGVTKKENLEGAFGSPGKASFSSNGYITVSVSQTTPPAANVAPGSKNVHVADFEVSTGPLSEAFVVKSLSISNQQTGITLLDLGENDHNIKQVTVVCEDKDGNSNSVSAELNEGVASFSGLNCYVSGFSPATIQVYVDLNPIGTVSLGETIKLSLAFNNFLAVGQRTGVELRAEYLNASLDDKEDLDIGEISYTNARYLLALDGGPQEPLRPFAANVTALVIDDTAGDNTNKLPAGALICIDDDNDGLCRVEDVFVVLEWPSSNTGTEDTVALMMVDDAGDSHYDDNDNILYALPGEAFLTETEAMTIKF